MVVRKIITGAFLFCAVTFGTFILFDLVLGMNEGLSVILAIALGLSTEFLYRKYAVTTLGGIVWIRN
ncbi:hypothetical protein [Sinobaca sp. H24]|uniref:hypothetical protein n=1 Tax=Sinobaca sp. H24 TaxID=2923376 RepID=UPI00207A198D|nr:hypothetical protein [Sinobaca sp. H24]